MRRIAAALSLFLVVIPEVASAHDHRPPRATLRIAGETQTGSRYSDGWIKTANEPGMCMGTFGDGFPRFKRPLSHQVGDEIAVRLHKSAVPMELSVHRWAEVDDDGAPKGSPVPVPFALRPLLAGADIVAWDVVILPPVIDGHLYLGVDGYWADEDGCGGFPDLGSQYALWTFHAVSET